MARYYVTGDGGVVRPAGFEEWRAWLHRSGLAAFEDGGRVVARTELPDAVVVTVFLGVDLGDPDGPPQVFETAVYYRDKLRTGGLRRYATEADALGGHEDAVETVTLEG